MQVHLMITVIQLRNNRNRKRPSGNKNKKEQVKVKEEKAEVEGTVVEALPNTQFSVRLDNGHEVLAYLSGRMRRYYIRILLGDRVRVEISPYDTTRGRITYRHKKNSNPTGA